MIPDDRLAAALQQLRSEYLADAPQRIAELWTAYARVQNGGVQSLEGLRHLAHRLAGTGSSYGLPVVTERARAVDQACRALLASGTTITPDDLQRLRDGVQGIANAFADATTSE